MSVFLNGHFDRQGFRAFRLYKTKEKEADAERRSLFPKRAFGVVRTVRAVALRGQYLPAGIGSDTVPPVVPVVPSLGGNEKGPDLSGSRPLE